MLFWTNKISFFGQDFLLVDFIIAIVLLVVGIVWLIALIIFFCRHKIEMTKTEEMIRKKVVKEHLLKQKHQSEDLTIDYPLEKNNERT